VVKVYIQCSQCFCPCLCVLQLMYKQNQKKDASSLYHLMPETIDTQFVRQQTEMLSEVRLLTKYKKSGREETGSSLFSVMPETLETQHAKQVSQIQSQVKYKEDLQKQLSSSLFSSLPQTLQTERAKEVTELQSQVIGSLGCDVKNHLTRSR
ncbi:hypothetical protein XENOCAPTIV_011729, partial [Xenoophorus captivus]